jgi:hypothetical protein
VIYFFVQAGKAGCIKIGYTDKLSARRMADLQVGCPQELHLLLLVLGGRKTEKKLHHRFARLRRRGEWFWPGRRLLAYIAERRGSAPLGELPASRAARPPRRPADSSRVTVWLQRFKDRPHLMLQWIDPDTGKRKSRSAGTADYNKAEQARGDLEYELNKAEQDEASSSTILCNYSRNTPSPADPSSQTADSATP